MSLVFLDYLLNCIKGKSTGRKYMVWDSIYQQGDR